MCDINLNFFNTTHQEIIKNMLNIELDNSNITESFKWINSNSSHSHGAFIQYSDDVYKALIFPKIVKLKFKKVDNIEEMVNNNNEDLNFKPHT